MAGLPLRGVTRVFKEQDIMPQRGGQPLHPIQLCKVENLKKIDRPVQLSPFPKGNSSL
jgi:hypothetical protein